MREAGGEKEWGVEGCLLVATVNSSNREIRLSQVFCLIIPNRFFAVA